MFKLILIFIVGNNIQTVQPEHQDWFANIQDCDAVGKASMDNIQGNVPTDRFAMAWTCVPSRPGLNQTSKLDQNTETEE